ncbi:MAG: hypothetical protein ABSG17_17965 [Spirochaetia bacterium]|jgi:hypothetical protein
MRKPCLLVLQFLLTFQLFAQNADLRGLKTVVGKLEGETAVVGKQYAVLIAINKYQNWMVLQNPVKDAQEIKEILARRYYVSDFMELYDEAATKADIIKLFDKLINDAKPEDSILIFYAGHGYLDKTSNTGFWIPVDGGMDIYQQANWLPNAQIRGFISNMRARHIALIADSCFSGDFLNPTRGMVPAITSEYFKNAYARISRQVLTSGASESVPDESQFTRQFKLALEGNTSPYLDPLMLYNQIRLGVTQTTPLFGDLKDSGHQQGSSFLLFLRNGAGQPKAQQGGSSEEDLSAKVKVSKAYGKATVETDASGTLFLDGISRGQVPVGSFATIENLVVGPHDLEMLYDNGEKEKQTITVKMGKTTAVDFIHPVKAFSKVPPAESSQTPAAEAPAKGSQKDELQDGDPLQEASIKIDGNFDDWNGILPAFASGERLIKYSRLAIAKLYLAVDKKNLYVRFDIMDDTPTSPVRPNNFSTDHNSVYNLELSNELNHVTASVKYSVSEDRWYVVIGRWVNGNWEEIDKSTSYAMKGSSLEASFPLDPMRKNLGDLSSNWYYVNANTQLDDNHGRWDGGTGDRTKTKRFILVPFARPVTVVEGQSTPSAEAPATVVPKAELSYADPLPQATIKIDGNFDDWDDILPAFASGTRSIENKSLAIDKVYLAVDEKSLYMRFDVRDRSRSSFFHPNNFDTAHSSTYGIHLYNGIDQVNCEIVFDPSPRVSQWQIGVVSYSNGGAARIPGTYGSFAMKGSSAEVAFPLELIKKVLGVPGASGHCQVSAYSGYHDSNWQWIQNSGDNTTSKEFIFVF